MTNRSNYFIVFAQVTPNRTGLGWRFHNHQFSAAGFWLFSFPFCIFRRSKPFMSLSLAHPEHFCLTNRTNTPGSWCPRLGKNRFGRTHFTFFLTLYTISLQSRLQINSQTTTKSSLSDLHSLIFLQPGAHSVLDPYCKLTKYHLYQQQSNPVPQS